MVGGKDRTARADHATKVNCSQLPSCQDTARSRGYTAGKTTVGTYGCGSELTFVTIDSLPNLLREIIVLSFSHLTFTRTV